MKSFPIDGCYRLLRRSESRPEDDIISSVNVPSETWLCYGMDQPELNRLDPIVCRLVIEGNLLNRIILNYLRRFLSCSIVALSSLEREHVIS